MRKIILLLIVTFSLEAYAQENKINIPRIQQKEDQLIVSLNFDNWNNYPEFLEVKPFRSRGFGILFMGDGMNRSGNAGFGLGFGFTSQNIHSNALVLDSGDNSPTYLSYVHDSVDMDLNKISLNYIDLAFELRFRTNENNNHQRFKLSVGIKGGILVQSHTKTVIDGEKFKTYGISNLNKFQYGLTGRLGYGSWAVSGYYSLADLFKEGKGPGVVPVSVGISITP